VSPLLGAALGGGAGWLGGQLVAGAYVANELPKIAEVSKPEPLPGSTTFFAAPSSAGSDTSAAAYAIRNSLLLVAACVVVGAYVGYRLVR
jgi:hypothetical protein